jgi:hypothetical protein
MDLCRRDREFSRPKKQSVKRPGSGASDHQDEHAAGYGEVLLEMQELVSNLEILVKQNGHRQTEQTQWHCYGNGGAGFVTGTVAGRG